MADMYKGYDLENKESMKVAVDVLVRVQAGEFINNTDHKRAVEQAYVSGIEEGKKQVPATPIDETQWVENGMIVEKTVGDTKTIINYTKKA